MNKRLLFLSILVVLTASLYCQESWNIDFVDEVHFLQFRKISVQNGNYFVSYGDGFLEYQPRTALEDTFVFAGNLPGTVKDMYIDGDFAYFACLDYGLQVVNISGTEEISYHDMRNDAYAVDIQDSLLYLADGKNGVLIFNITNPLTPIVIGEIALTGTSIDIAVNDNLAYVVNSDTDIIVLDISDPQSPSIASSYNTSGTTGSIELFDIYAMLTLGTDGIQIVNLSNPSNITEVSSFDTDGEAIGVSISDNKAYIADGSNGLRIIELMDINNPVEIAGIELGYEVIDCCTYDNKLYLANSFDGALIYDISNPTSPVEFTHTEGWSTISGSVFYGDTLFTCGWRKIYIIDYSEMNNPQLLSEVTFNNTMSDLVVEDDYLYVAAGYGGIQIYNIEDITNPVKMSSIICGARAERVDVEDDICIVSFYQQRILDSLYIYDISDRSNPVKLSSFAYDYLSDYKIVDNYVYFAHSPNILKIFDISDPHNPVILPNSIEERGSPYEISIHDTLAFLDEFVVNISDPLDPVFITELDHPDVSIYFWYQHFIEPSFYIGVDFYDGLRILDISDIYNPVEVGYYRTDNFHSGLTIHNNFIYLRLAYKAYQLLDISDSIE